MYEQQQQLTSNNFLRLDEDDEESSSDEHQPSHIKYRLFARGCPLLCAINEVEQKRHDVSLLLVIKVKRLSCIYKLYCNGIVMLRSHKFFFHTPFVLSRFYYDSLT